MDFQGSRARQLTESYGFAILLLIVLGIVLACLLSGAPPPWRAALLASLCGASVAVAEIVSRYRDEPLQATFSPFGLIYIAFNAAIALGLLAVVLRYKVELKLETIQPFWAALLTGFGSTALMRTRLAVIRGSDNKDISIGPDIVVKTLLQMADQYIDRARASARLALVVRHIDEITSLGNDGTPAGSFSQAADYMLASLLAFQNLDDSRKKQLHEVMTSYNQSPAPAAIKYFALGFVFLTLSGERHFTDVVRNAVLTKEKSKRTGVENP